MNRTLLTAFAGITCIFSYVANADNWLSWSEFDQDGKNMKIYLARESAENIEAVQVITQRGLNMTPTLLETEDDLWIAWIDRGNRYDYRLRYARIDPTTMNTREIGTLSTSDRKMYAPSLAISAQGWPVLSWSGYDGNDSEIRYAFFRKGTWSPETRVTDNEIPDTLPLMTTNQSNELILSWEQLDNARIIVREYTMGEDLSSHNTADASQINEAKSKTIEERQLGRSSQNLAQLPPYLSKRQSRFFSGTRLPVLQ